jgi:LysM repeat protein
VNTAALGATFEANKVPIMAAAGAGVVGLALLHKKKTAAASSTAAAGGAVATSQTTSGYSTGAQTAGMNGAPYYDSSASDVYGAIQPQLESLGGQLTDITNRLNNTQQSTMPVSAPTPVVTPAPAPAPAPAPKPYVAPAPPPVPVAAPPAHAVDTWVTVNRGDTLSGIAARFPQRNITAASIGRDNGIANLNLIHPGQRLHILG